MQEFGSGGVGDPLYYLVRLDGFLGGEKVQRVILDVNTPVNRPLAGFRLPNVVPGESAICYLEIASGRSVYIDDNIGDMGNAIK